MIYTQLHGKRNSVDNYLIFLSYTLTLLQLILMIVIHRHQILLLSHVPIFMIHTMVKIGNPPTFYPPTIHPPDLKLNGQSQDIETTTDQAQNDNSEQTFEPSTDTETTRKPMPQPTTRHNDTPSTIEVNDPTTENFPQNEPSHSRGGNYNLRPNPNPNYSELYRY